MSDKDRQNGLDHDMVQDLLPSYMDHLTQESTSRKIEEHLRECETCRRVYEAMKEPVENDSTRDQRDADYLKTIRRKTNGKIHRVVLICLVIVLLTVGVSGFVWLSSELSPALLDTGVLLSDGKLQITLASRESEQGILRVSSSRSETSLYLNVYGGSGLLNRKESVTLEFPDAENIRDIYENDMLIWQDGVMIQNEILKLYEERSEAENADWGAEAAGLTGLTALYGPCSLEVQKTGSAADSVSWNFTFSDEALYSWALDAESSLIKGTHSRLKQAAILMFLTTEHLEKIEFIFPQDGRGSIGITYNRQEVCSGDPDPVTSPSQLQRAADEAGWSASGEIYDGAQSAFEIELINGTRTEFVSMMAQTVLDGTESASMMGDTGISLIPGGTYLFTVVDSFTEGSSVAVEILLEAKSESGVLFWYDMNTMAIRPDSKTVLTIREEDGKYYLE